MGAIVRESSGGPDGVEREAALAVDGALGLSRRGLWLPEWNDAPEREHGEVLAALDAAIVSFQ